MLKEGIIIGERYEIMNRVGSGGMADVYKAMDHKLNRLVAVKMLKAEFRGDRSFIAKFRKEAQAAAGLTHPNIVSVYDVGEDRGLYYIVMELVEGITLKNYIAKKGKLSVKEATSIAIQVALGLECAHNQGIIHRDVKPQNIMISVDGKVKLSDFGIAKAINANTITANVMGSVHFSSPEQVRGGFSDSKSDIYSLGITMYEMVTGRVPFDGDTTVSIAIKHLQEEIVPPSRYTPDLPYSLEQIILKCTQKNPERRYSSAGQLIDDLKHSLIDPQGNFVIMGSSGKASVSLPDQMAAAAAAEKARAAQNSQNLKKSKNRKASLSDEDDDYDREKRRKKDDYYDKRKSSGKKRKDSDAVNNKLEKAITIGGFVIGIVIIIILVIVIGNMAGLFNKKTGTAVSNTTTSSSDDITNVGVIVPSFLGKTVEEAQTIASQYGLTINQVGEESSEVYAAGQIVSQDPVSGATADSATVINVVVSSGSNQITVPSGLVGVTQTEAEAILSQYGLNVSAELQASDVEIGRVIAVDPAEGTSVSPGSLIHLYVSKGSETTVDGLSVVPTVIGYDLNTATSTLNNNGFNSNVVYQTSDVVASGLVISSDPVAGATAQSGSTVTLYVSSGNEGSWVNTDPFLEPGVYMGQSVRIELIQNGVSSVVYEGSNPFGDDNYYSDKIIGQPGVTTGTVNIYDLNDNTLLGTYELTFGPA